jgi:Protein of unknown function (DUF4065)
MGESNGEKLTNALFEAWDFGPVEPTVYRKVKIFGADAVQDVFYGARHFKIDDARQMALTEVCDTLLPLRPSALVNVTHWKDGAWAHNYVPGGRGIRISDADIALEYRRRVEAYSYQRHWPLTQLAFANKHWCDSLRVGHDSRRLRCRKQ